MERTAVSRRVSRALHVIGDFTSHASTSAGVAVALAIFFIVLASNHFPDAWQTIFATITESFALIMLFVIQHTQNRQQLVLQLKLDELIRASPNADDLLVHLEVAGDEELIEREESQLAHHESLRESDDVS